MVKEQAIESSVMDVNSKHTYVLSQKSQSRGMTYDDKNNLRPDPEFPKQRNLLLRSSIIWPGGKDPFSGSQRAAGKYLIRFYDGCTSLFVDDQPKDRETIDQFVRSTRELLFQSGYIHIYGYDKMLITYLDWCSWNENSPYRVPTIDAIFKKLDADADREFESASVDEIELALKYAKEASEEKMIVHSKFLDVPEVDWRTGEKLSIKSIKTEYRKAALNDTKRFLQTYNDKTMHLRYWITKHMENGEISTKKVPNHAAWLKTGKVICDISGLTTPDVILHKLIEFSQTEEGAEFKSQLTQLNK